MHQLDWMTRTLSMENLDWPAVFEAMVAAGTRHQQPYYCLDAADGVNEINSMHRQFPICCVISFARRMDFDGVVCVVLADQSLNRGQVVIVHDDAVPGHEVDDEYKSIADWTKAARDEIDERVREGWNKPIKDLLD